MNVEVHRAWFITGSLTLILLAAIPTLALFIHIPSGLEKFSELWLLGPGHKAENYPFNVKPNETYNVFVGVGNHLGYPAYYKVCVTARNQTQALPASNATSSILPPLYEFSFFIGDGEAREALLRFEFLNFERSGNFITLDGVSINEVVLMVNNTSAWDSVRNGFYFQLIFELWLYDVTSKSFQYNNRFVGIWLNMTSWV